MNSVPTNLVNAISSLSTDSCQQLMNLLQQSISTREDTQTPPPPPCPSNYVQTVHRNPIYPSIAIKPNTGPMPTDFSLCRDVTQCCSMKRILKLGVFYSKYGVQNTTLITQFMSASTEYDDLKTDYRHSIQCHSGNSDKHKISQMSRDYESIFDFIGNFKHVNANLSYANFKFYISQMDSIYEGVKTTIVTVTPATPPAVKTTIATPSLSLDVIEHRRKLKDKRVQKMNDKIQVTSKPKPVPQRRYQCDLCHKSYKHLCNWRSHKKVHTDEAFICVHCGKRFGRKANYKEHLRIHTGEAPYHCDVCHKKFKHHHSWKDHQRIHTGIQPYQCHICKKKFKVSHNLTVHLRIHTGEKPYECKICFKKFRQKSAINSHIKRNHYHECNSFV
eukprot:524844_1